ncbi:MAG: glycosyltransferase family 4 protein [Fluviicola sp.]
MKVCHFTSVHNWNDIRIFQKECVSLAKGGYEVHLVAGNCSNELIKGVHIHGVKLAHKSRFDRMWKSSKLIFQKALSIDADIYHFHDPELLRFALKLKRKGKIVIYDAHEDLPKQIKGKYWINKYLRSSVAFVIRAYENFVCKRIDGVFTATPFIADRFLKVNSNTIAINNFPMLNELENFTPWSEKNNFICYIGGISEIRGLSQVVDALELQNQFHLQLAGPITNGSNNFENQLKSKKGWELVNYLGVIDRESVKKVMSESKVGLVTFLPLPNHVDAQPNKMFEYMSAGIPVIGSHFQLWKDILEKNNCGICVDPESPEQISKALKQISDDEELAQKMGQNGREAVLKHYNWESESTRLLSYYSKFTKC